MVAESSNKDSCCQRQIVHCHIVGIAWWEDSFQYLHGSTSGDLSIEMFVESLTGSSLHQWAKGGLMLRNSLDSNFKHFNII